MDTSAIEGAIHETSTFLKSLRISRGVAMHSESAKTLHFYYEYILQYFISVFIYIGLYFVYFI